MDFQPLDDQRSAILKFLAELGLAPLSVQGSPVLLPPVLSKHACFLLPSQCLAFTATWLLKAETWHHPVHSSKPRIHALGRFFFPHVPSFPTAEVSIQPPYLDSSSLLTGVPACSLPHVLIEWWIWNTNCALLLLNALKAACQLQVQVQTASLTFKAFHHPSLTYLFTLSDSHLLF